MQKNTNMRVPGCIIAANDDMVTIEFSEDVSSYRNGQHIIVSIPYERKTALGPTINVAEIVAYGEISNIDNNVISIKSKRSNPIISKHVLLESQGKECVMIVEALS